MKRNTSIGIEIFNFLRKHFEIIFTISIFIVLFVFFSIYAAGPYGSDELLYADAGLRGYGNYIVMNRYTHIYLQLLFITLANSPLLGIRVFWGFVMSVSSVSVFLLGRYILKTHNFIHGLFALLIFLSMNLFRRYFGIPIVDLTTMMMVLLFLLVFILYIRKNQSKWIIILLGALFLLAFKTKEFSVILLISLPAFGFDQANKFQWKRFLFGCLYFLIGILIGVAIVILLNTFILSDPLFGVRFSDWINFRKTILTITTINPNPESYLQSLIWPVYSLSFILYLLSFAKRLDEIQWKEKLIWVIPLLYIMMMIFLMFRSGWRTDERYLYPIIGIVAFLAPQYFEFRLPIEKKGKVIYFLAILGGCALVFLIRLLLQFLGNAYGMTLSEIVLHYAVDLFFVSLLLAMFIIREKSPYASVIFMVLLSLNLFFSLSMNLKAALRHENTNEVNNRFAYLSLPDGEIELCQNTTIELSPQMLTELKIHPDPYEAAGMFNIAYDFKAANRIFHLY